MFKNPKILGLAMAAALSACGAQPEQDNTQQEAGTSIQAAAPSVDDRTADQDASSNEETPAYVSTPDVERTDGTTSVSCVDANGLEVYSRNNVEEADVKTNISTFTLPAPTDKEANSSQDTIQRTETVKGHVCTATTKYYTDKDAGKVEAYRKTQSLKITATDGFKILYLSNVFSDITNNDENTTTFTLENSDKETLEKVVTAAPGIISVVNPQP